MPPFRHRPLNSIRRLQLLALGLFGLATGACEAPGGLQFGPASELCAQLSDVSAEPIDVDLERQDDTWLIHFDAAAVNSVYLDRADGEPVYTVVCDDPLANCLTSPVHVGATIQGASAFETGDVDALVTQRKTVAVYAIEGGATCPNTAEGIETFDGVPPTAG